jgi:hypothetical protein
MPLEEMNNHSETGEEKVSSVGFISSESRYDDSKRGDMGYESSGQYTLIVMDETGVQSNVCFFFFFFNHLSPLSLVFYYACM